MCYTDRQARGTPRQARETCSTDVSQAVKHAWNTPEFCETLFHGPGGSMGCHGIGGKSRGTLILRPLQGHLKYGTLYIKRYLI